MNSGGTWRLGHRPGLDGLRGVAVLLVVAYHVVATMGVGWFAGNTVGVTVFFVLSGFLITSLLLEDRARGGRVHLRQFYARRARRLLPAFLFMLAVVSALSVVIGVFDRSAFFASLLYSANWLRASGHRLGLLDHTWTLSVEEQFYLLWPLTLIFLRRSRWLPYAVTSLAIAGPLARIALETGGVDVRVLYYTGGDALLAGCALALWLNGRTVPPAPAWAPAAAVVGLLAVCVVPMSLMTAGACATALSLLVVYVVATGTRVSVLSSPVLRVLGRRSYGLYLWHSPAIAFTAHMVSGSGRSFWWLIPALVATAVITECSWRFVEQPFLRRRAARPGGQPRGSIAAPSHHPETVPSTG